MEENLDKQILEQLGISDQETNIIDEAEDIIEETYSAMGLNKTYTISSSSTKNFIIKNGRTEKEKVSNTGGLA